MKTISATGRTVRNAVAESRRLLGVTRQQAPIVSDVDHEDGLHRVTLKTGDVIEVSITRRSKSTAVLLGAWCGFCQGACRLPSNPDAHYISPSTDGY